MLYMIFDCNSERQHICILWWTITLFLVLVFLSMKDQKN